MIVEIYELFLLDAPWGDVRYMLQRGVRIGVSFNQIDFFVSTTVELPSLRAGLVSLDQRVIKR